MHWTTMYILVMLRFKYFNLWLSIADFFQEKPSFLFNLNFLHEKGNIKIRDRLQTFSGLYNLTAHVNF